MSRPIRQLIFAVLAALAALPLAARELHWTLLDVQARLDADGRLHVVEQQHFVFTGDWNGGERKFNLRTGQDLELKRMTRIDESGARIDLAEGDLAEVDRYDWENGALRWRSRLPSDPPFQNTRLVYELEYVLSNILVTTGDVERYVLDHDFAFAERDGVIERFTLDLQIDPPWKTIGSVERSYEAGPLQPGASFPLDVVLAYEGGGLPAGVKRPAPAALLAVIFLGIAAIVGTLLFSFFKGERDRGRFRQEPIGTIDAAWLQRHVFFESPEVIGALWDTTTGAAEVAAMLARLAVEKKIETTVTKKGRWSAPVMSMRLLVPRSEFISIERELVDAFFVDGDAIDTERIRSHYKSTGFTPASVIREPLEKVIESNPEWKDQPMRRNWWRDVLLLLAALGSLVPAVIVGGGEDLVAAILTGFSSIFVLVFASIVAANSRWATRNVGRWAFFFTLPTLLQLAVIGFLMTLSTFPISALTFVACGFVICAAYWFVLGFAPFRESLARLAVRRRLVAARDWFVLELRQQRPSMRDEWFPYLIAFGLGDNVDRWFSSYGNAVGSSGVSRGSGFSGSSGSSSSSGSGTSSVGGGWSGGGTSFGGAGATGAWSAAAGGLAAGVSAPSSSSGGGGGGGGSSSGGGGGGGW